MDIIIDTNIFFGDWLLRTKDSINFLSFVNRTGSDIYFPRIIWEELISNYRIEMTKKYSSYVNASKLLRGNLPAPDEFKIIEIVIEDIVNNYIDLLHEKIYIGNKILHMEIIPKG